MSGKCGGGSGKKTDEDADDDATELERWQNVEILLDMAAQHADRALVMDVPDVDAEDAQLEVLRTPVGAINVQGATYPEVQVLLISLQFSTSVLEPSNGPSRLIAR